MAVTVLGWAAGRRIAERTEGLLAADHVEAELARLREERDAARDALVSVRRECDLPEHIAEIVGAAINAAEPSFDDAVRGIETRGRDAV